MLTSEQFDRTKRLALDLAGIELAARHRELLDRRSRRFEIESGAGLDALLGEAEGGDAQARKRLIALLTTNFTGFFRHPWHFHVAAEHALWAAHRRGRARVWSAAAATGEEPYSMAMALVEVFRRDDPPVSILATDVDAGALEIARRGEYGDAALSGLEPQARARFFPERAGSGRWRIAAAVGGLVEFREANLAESGWTVEGPWDVVLCRNVLMYLERDRRERAVERIASMLAPGGLLLLDPVEHLGGAAGLFGRGENGVFTRLRREP
jgi:chemotaxis protein methyltransferase CheR